MKKVIITDGRIEISGFNDIDFRRDHLGSCRDVMRVALAWAAKRANDELSLDLIGDWDKQKTVLMD